MLVTGLACGLVLFAGAPPASAAPAPDRLGSAQQRAAALRQQVADLEHRTDAAVEQYDAEQESLASAVSRQVEAAQAYDAARAAASAGVQARIARVRTLYEVGGSAAALGGLLTGTSPLDALRGVHDAQRLLGTDGDTAARESAGTRAVSDTARRAEDAAAAQVRQTQRVQALVGQVEDLLAQQRALLAAADADVVRIAAQQRAEAERRQQEAFQAALAAARAAAARTAAASTAAVSSTGVASVGGPVPGRAGQEVPAAGRAAAAIAAARLQLGKPYVWGATGPDSFDCSGLTRWAYAAAGVHLPRTAQEQWSGGSHPGLADLQPGDLLFWAGGSDPSTIHHVALYIGGGRMIAAPHTGTVVQVQDVYEDGYYGATRVV